jgi:hypothetical protein
MKYRLIAHVKSDHKTPWGLKKPKAAKPLPCESLDFDVSCQGSEPKAIIAFPKSADFENAVRQCNSR